IGSGVGLNFHTTTMGGSRPRALAMDNYLSAPVWAQAAGFRMMTYGSVLEFWEARRSPLHQEWSGDTLTVRSDVTSAAGLVLQLQARGGERACSAIRVAGTGVWRLAGAASGPWLDVPVAAAPFQVQALYPPGAAEPRR